MHSPIVFPVRTVFDIDIRFECRVSILPKAALDRPRLDQRHVDPGSRELHAQRVGQALDSKLARVVGAPPLQRHQTEYRAVLNNAPVALAAHDRQHPACQLVPAEKVGLGKQCMDW